MNAPAPTTESVGELRFGQVGMASVRVRRADAAALYEELSHKVHAAPQLFSRTAVVLDLSHMLDLPDDATVDALLEAVREAGMLPVGLAYGTRDTEALAARMGLPLIAKFRAAYERESESQDTPPRAVAAPPAPAAPAPAPQPAATVRDLALRHTQPIRSGQQIYAKGRDLVVTTAVANAAEIIADGSIHIYGALRGRALAGAQGNEDARIFCSDFRAELISIAGQYRVFEQIPPELEGQSVQCWLEDGKLLIERL